MANPLYDSLFAKHAGKSKPFLMLPGGGTVNYTAFLEKAAQFAHVFRALGLIPGDRVAVQVAKSPEALAIYAACVQAGLVFLPLNTGYRAAELGYFVENSAARVLVCDTAMRDSLAVIGVALETLNADGSGTLSDQSQDMPKEFPTVSRNQDDLAALLYTSGTTGRSKGAMLTQRNLLSNCLTLVEYWQFTEGDTLLHALPIFHTHGLFVATNVILAVGGMMQFLPKFDLDKMIDFMPQATTMMGVPTFYTRLLNDARLTKNLTGNMRLFISGSAPLLTETHAEFEARTGHKILERYGMTETNMNTSNPYNGDRRAGTVGYPLPDVELKITDPATGHMLPHEKVGQIEVRGPNVFSGYWQMPEKTAEELRPDGFFITGDLGKLDRHGYLHIIGRSKDLIISGGFNIYPKEIEEVLDALPGIMESAVIGVPHPDLGEAVLAILVPKSGAELNITAIEIKIATALARFKHPRRYEVLPELPRNTMGKVQKNLLREAHKNMFS